MNFIPKSLKVVRVIFADIGVSCLRYITVSWVNDDEYIVGTYPSFLQVLALLAHACDEPTC